MLRLRPSKKDRRKVHWNFNEKRDFRILRGNGGRQWWMEMESVVDGRNEGMVAEGWI